MPVTVLCTLALIVQSVASAFLPHLSTASFCLHQGLSDVLSPVPGMWQTIWERREDEETGSERLSYLPGDIDQHMAGPGFERSPEEGQRPRKPESLEMPHLPDP